MSKTVDTRTVEMRFDNKNFESNVKQSMSTLDKLKHSLKLKGATKSLEEVEKKSKRIEFKDLNNNVQKIGKSFSALEKIAEGVLLRIGMKAADTGMKLAKSLSVDQVASGWNKYAEKTTAVQTIMANLKDDAAKFVDEASKMDYINAQLERLMWFSDETSYNFTDMTGNVGKFIANGQGLEESVTAMQGIATWAAKSGQNAQTASRAMYNISQAMGVGAMTVQDWKSIEIANMATSEFKELAIAIGVNKKKIKQGQVTITNFRESLQKKWFDKDVMMEVFETYGEAANKIQMYAKTHNTTATEAIRELKKTDEEFANSLGFRAFAAAQEAKTFGEAVSATADAVSTKWSSLFEKIFGNYLQAKELWTALSEDLYDIFAEPLNRLNEIASFWNRGFFKGGAKNELERAFEIGALDDLDSSFKYVSKDAAELAVATDSATYSIKTLEDGSQELVKRLKASNGKYYIYTKKIFQADKNLISGREDLLAGFKNLIDTFFHDTEDEDGNEILSVLGTIKKAFQEVFFPDDKYFVLGNKLWDLTARFKAFTERIKPTQEVLDKIKNSFKGLFTIFKIIGKIIKAIVKPFKEVFQDLLGSKSITKGIWNVTDSLSNWIQELNKFLDASGAFEKISKKIHDGLDALSKALTGLSLTDLIKKIRSDVIEFFTNFDFKKFFDDIVGWIQSLKLDKVFTSVIKIVKGIFSFFKRIITEISALNTDSIPEKLTPIQNFWIGLKELLSGIKSVMPYIIGAATTIIKYISVPFRKIATLVGSLLTNIGNVLDNISNKTEKVKKASRAIKRNTKDSSAALNGLGDLFKGLVILFANIVKTLGLVGSKLGKIFAGIGIVISRFVEKNGVEGLLKFTVVVFLLVRLIGLIRRVKWAIESVNVLLEGLTDLLDEARLQSKFERITSLVKSVALLVMALGASIALMSKAVKNIGIGKVLAITGVLLIFTAIPIALAVFADKIFGEKTAVLYKTLPLISGFMIAISAFILLIAKAFSNFAKIKFDNATVGVISFIFLGFIALVAIIALAVKEYLAKGNTKKLVVALANMSGFMIAVAASLVVLARAFSIMGNVNANPLRLLGISAIFTSFIGICILTAFAVKSFMKNAKGDSIVKKLAVMSGFMLAVAFTLNVVAIAFRKFAKIKFENTSVGVISAIFAAFIAICILAAFAVKSFMKNAKGDSIIKKFAVMSGFMLAVAFTLNVVAIAFGKFAKIKFENTSVGVISAIFAAFTIIATGMAALGSVLFKKAEAIAGVATMSASMLAAAASIFMVATALAAIPKDVSVMQLVSILSIIVVLSLVISGMAAIGTALASTGYGLAGMALIALIITAIGVACLGAGAGMAMFVNAISGLIVAIVTLMEAVNEYGQEFIDNLGVILDKSLDNIINSAPKMKDAAVSVIKAIASGIIEAAPYVSFALTELLLYLMENVDKTTKASIPVLINTFTGLVPVILSSIADDIRKNTPLIIDACWSIFEAVLEAVFLFIGSILEKIPGIGKTLSNAVADSIIPYLRKSFEIVDEEGDSMTSKVIGLNKELDTTKHSVKSFIDEIKGAFTGKDGIFSGLDNIDLDALMPDIASFFGGQLKETELAIDHEAPAIQERLRYAYNSGALDKLNSGFKYITKSAAESAEEMDRAHYRIQTLEDGTQKLWRRIETENGYRYSVKDIIDPYSDDPLSGMMSSLSGTFGDMESMASTSGTDMMTGWISSVGDRLPDVEEVMNKFADTVSGPIHCSEPDYGPLSDLHTYGPDLVKEWCKSVDNNLHLVDDTSDSFANRIKDCFRNALDYVSSLIDGGMSDELTIRPIMDLSQIQNGVGLLDSMLSNRNYSIQGTTGIASSTAYNMRSSGLDKQPKVVQQPTSSDTINNTFYITNNDPNAVAEKVSRILNNQVKRKKAVWAYD